MTSVWIKLVEQRSMENFYCFSDSWDVKNNCCVNSELVDKHYVYYKSLSEVAIDQVLKFLNFSPIYPGTNKLEFYIRGVVQNLTQMGWRKHFDLHFKQTLAVWSFHKMHDCLAVRGLEFLKNYTWVLTRLVWVLTCQLEVFAELSFRPGTTDMTKQNHVFTIIRKSVRLLYCEKVIDHLQDSYLMLDDQGQITASQYFKRLGAFLHILAPEYKPKITTLVDLAGMAAIKSVRYPSNSCQLLIMPGSNRNRKYLVFPPRCAEPKCFKELPVEIRKYVTFRQHLRTTGGHSCFWCSNMDNDFLFHRNLPQNSVDQSVYLTSSLRHIFVRNNFLPPGCIPFKSTEKDQWERNYRFM